MTLVLLARNMAAACSDTAMRHSALRATSIIWPAAEGQLSMPHS